MVVALYDIENTTKHRCVFFSGVPDDKYGGTMTAVDPGQRITDIALADHVAQRLITTMKGHLTLTLKAHGTPEQSEAETTAKRRGRPSNATSNVATDDE